ncbi:MAG TPA: efflux RND transporter periplasmic adaptor subunit [Candidatus Polarisedimenticolaceae bacterium]|nr:efflux RND transporter periplasmic adaptor subunit [Candidatus Polarisedimenticolaceae bacterium]
MIESTSSMDRPAVTSRRPRLLWLAGIGLCVLLAAAMATPAVLRWARADRAVDASKLRFGTVTRGDLLRDLSLQARVVASLSPTLFSPGQGIVALRTRAGSEVKRGDVLAVVDSPELAGALDQARALLLASRAELERQKIAARQSQQRAQQQVDLLTLRLETARRQLDRAERTFKEGLSSRADYEAAQDAVGLATIELEQARREISLTRESTAFEVTLREQELNRQASATRELQERVDKLTLRAPFDGMVATVAVQDRDAVAPNQAVLTVVNLGSLELEIGLPEEYGSETSSGTPASIAFLGKEYPGHVTAVSPEVVNNELTATVVFDGPPPQGLKQSQRLTTRLTFESRRNVLKVPRGAFLEAEGGRAAYVVDGGGKIATRRAIVTGVHSVGEVEIVSGLAQGERIVASDTGAFARARTVLLR